MAGHKSPLSLLCTKMKLKAENDEGYAQFHKELAAVVEEQQKFSEEVEYDIAVAESLDPVQDCFFSMLQPCPCHQKPPPISTIKNKLQGDDAVLQSVLTKLKAKMNLIGHHVSGAASCRKRFASMLNVAT